MEVVCASSEGKEGPRATEEVKNFFYKLSFIESQPGLC